MPRRLLRDGGVVEDDWQYLAETTGADNDAARRVILTLDQWLADRAPWMARGGPLGVVLSPAHKVDVLAPDLASFQLICAEFSGPSEGRGYTQGRLLRERYGFKGELRATGYVRRDQLFFLARCGFNSFEMKEADLAHATDAFKTFTAEYQPSNDRGLGRKLRHRWEPEPGPEPERG